MDNRDLGKCDTSLTLSHQVHIALDGGMEERLVQLNFSAAFHRVKHHGLLYKRRSINVGG